MKKFIIGLLLMLSIVTVIGNVQPNLIGAEEIPEPRTIIAVKNT